MSMPMSWLLGQGGARVCNSARGLIGAVPTASNLPAETTVGCWRMHWKPV